MDKEKNKKYDLNNDNHSITHILLTICFLLCLANLWFSINTYFAFSDYMDVQSGKVNKTEVIYMDER